MGRLSDMVSCVYWIDIGGDCCTFNNELKNKIKEAC